MNFCKKNDKYISLYIDELLDDKTRIEFLKHIQECSQCASKLKEALYFAQLCREDQDITLPDGFNSSLHSRLLEVSASKSNLGFLVYNKKFIASLSTAAVLVISLLAYNLFPQIGSNKEASSQNTQVETSSVADSYGDSNESDNRIMTEGVADSAATDSSVASSQAEMGATKGDVDTTVTFSKVAPKTSQETSEQVTPESLKGAEERSPSSQEPIKKKEINDETALYIMKTEDQLDTYNDQYFLNYVELNMIVTPGGIGIEDLRKFMNELGAIEPKPVTISSVAENSDDTSTETTIKIPEFVDYYLPLSLYSTMNDQATKHKLDLSSKTEIITNDITNKYKELNTQVIEIDKKIEETLKNGGDTSDFEAEKTRITEEMNKIIAAREMITVRVFFIGR